MVQDMPRRRRELLEAIQRAGDWVNRDQLATATGKVRLSPNDHMHLEKLVTDGLIEVETRTARGPVGRQYYYRPAKKD